MRRVVCGTALAMLALVVVGAPAARPAADDVSLDIFLRAGNLLTQTRGPTFQIAAEVSTEAGVPQHVTATITLPSGLDWGSDAPDPSEGCTGTRPAVCRLPVEPNPAGTVGVGWVWDVVSQAPGLYEISGRVEPDEPDLDLANNTDRFRFEVLPATPGGGGGDEGGASVTAGAAKLAPTPIKAGSIVTASVRIVLDGTPVRPTRVACAGTVGGVKVRGTPRATRGQASCTYRTSRAAQGKTLRGSVSFTARGERYVRRFAARLR